MTTKTRRPSRCTLRDQGSKGRKGSSGAACDAGPRRWSGSRDRGPARRRGMPRRARLLSYASVVAGGGRTPCGAIARGGETALARRAVVDQGGRLYSQMGKASQWMCGSRGVRRGTEGCMSCGVVYGSLAGCRIGCGIMVAGQIRHARTGA